LAQDHRYGLAIRRQAERRRRIIGIGSSDIDQPGQILGRDQTRCWRSQRRGSRRIAAIGGRRWTDGSGNGGFCQEERERERHYQRLARPSAMKRPMAE